MSPVVAIAVLLATSPPARPDEFAATVLPVIERTCAGCHDAETAKGELVLTTIPTDGAARARGAEFWDEVRQRLLEGEMPPPRKPQPSAEERAAVVAWIDALVAEAAPPRPVLRRLNDLEYENAVRDLFGLEFRARGRFPADGVAQGFATVGAALSLSTLELELYLEAAEEIAARAIVVDDSRTPVARRFAGEELGEVRRRGGRTAVPLTSTSQRATARVVLPRAGTYRVSAEILAQQAGEDLARAALVVDGIDRHEQELTEGLDAGAQTVAATLELPGGERLVEVRFVNDYYEPEHPEPGQRDRNLYVTAVGVEGPLDARPPSAFQERLSERFGGERERVAHLARRVWRRPIGGAELDRLLAVAPVDAPADVRLRQILTVLLASPNFLFRVERDGVDEGQLDGGELDDWALAARLAAFLWASVPGERLDALADAGELGREEVLRALVAEMIADPRARGMAEGFALSWLQLDALEVHAPDPERFPGWSGDLAASMREESARFFLEVLRGGRSVWELVEADWTIVDAALAEHYGLAERPAEFTRVAVGEARGVLGHAGVLTVTSEPTRTSPVKRGKWVLEVLFNDPPPAPPPGVGALEEDAPGTIRERLEEHAANPDCAACHARMDPLGFGLEVFDPVGRPREAVGGAAVDAVGTLPDGRTFVGPEGLARVLRADGALPRAVVEKLFVYGLGRPLGAADRALVEDVLARAGDGAALSDLVLQVVLSEPFRSRP